MPAGLTQGKVLGCRGEQWQKFSRLFWQEAYYPHCFIFPGQFNKTDPFDSAPTPLFPKNGVFTCLNTNCLVLVLVASFLTRLVSYYSKEYRQLFAAFFIISFQLISRVLRWPFLQGLLHAETLILISWFKPLSVRNPSIKWVNIQNYEMCNRSVMLMLFILKHKTIIIWRKMKRNKGRK